MKKIVLGILQGFSKAFFAIYVLAIFLMIVGLWGVFFVRGGQAPLDAGFLGIIFFGQELSGGAVEYLLELVNTNVFTATLTLVVISLFLLFTVWSLYVLKKFLLALRHDQWFHERNTIRLRYLSVYFFLLAVLNILLSFLAFKFLEGHSMDLSLSFSSGLNYGMLGAGLLMLSYMHQQGVKLREEAELIV